VALALPGAAAYAAAMDVVTTRSDQNIDEQYGRDSVYAFSRDAKPLKPEQTGSHPLPLIGGVVDKTKHFFAGAWDKTTGLFKHDDRTAGAYAASSYEPQPYGRAGGYAGSDRVAVIAQTSAPYAANTEIVKSGQDANVAASPADYPREAPLAARANSTVDTRDMAGNRDTMSRRTRNDNAPSAAVAPAPSEPSVITAPVVEERTVVAPVEDSSTAPTAVAPAPVEEDHSSAATDMRDQGNVTPDANGSSSDVVHSGSSEATDNGRAQGDRFDQPDAAHGQLENETQTR